MIKRFGRDSESEGFRLDMSSLTDVGFLLLIYFLVTSTLDPKEGDLAMTLPPPERTSPSLANFVFDPPLIVVDRIGNVLMEDELLDTDPGNRTLVNLEDRLSTFVESFRVAGQPGKPGVELKVDDSVPAQRFIDVMNCLAKVGIEDVVLDGFHGE